MQSVFNTKLYIRSSVAVLLSSCAVRTVSDLTDRQPAELFSTKVDKSLQIVRHPDALPVVRIR